MIKKIAIVFGFLVSTSALFSQVISANFEVDMEGWTSHQSIEWSKLISSLEHRGGISFSGENPNENLFLFIQKEITELRPNTNYRVMFNMNWLCWLEPSALPILVKVGATNQEPIIEPNPHDFIVAGRLTPHNSGHPFLQNVQNFDNAFFVNTNDEGRLFLMIGIEFEDEKLEHVFLNTLRVTLRENGEARGISNVETVSNVEVLTNENVLSDDDLIFEIIPKETSEIQAAVTFVPNAENDLVFFKSDYNDEIEMVNIYTEDNHLVKIFTFRNPSDDRAFLTTGLVSGTYRMEFVLSDGRVLNKFYNVK